MSKKIIALFAVCSMLTGVSAGMVQTAYADGEPNVRIEVADANPDGTEKVLTFYYEGVESFVSISGYFDFFDDETNDLVEAGSVTVDSLALTINGQYQDCDPDTRVFYSTESRKGRTISSEDSSFATATITVPTDIDITLECVIDAFVDTSNVDHCDDIGTITVVIPKKEAAPPEPEVDTSVEESAAYTVADGYDADVVVGTIQLDVTGAAIDLTAATYEGKTPTDVTGDNVTSFQGSALITVIINGATSTEALSQIVFN